MTHILGIDIGTTNIEYALADDSGKIIFEKLTPNPLSRYGLDVMTRITRANEGKLDEMCDLLRETLRDDIRTILKKSACLITDLLSINIAANTTMVHILMDYDCKQLGSFPFSPVHTEAVKTDSKALGLTDEIPVLVNITRGFSAYVGGDIYSGLKTLPSCDDMLFIDMGTNAEMVLMLGSEMFITSAAAGPAFETCAKGHASDAIDGLAKMLSTGIMDETGLLSDEYFDNGYDCNGIHFSQKKIRDFQMAKSAIRTGIDLLISQVGDDITGALQVYVAGNFGFNIDTDNCISLGMFPSWFKGKTTAVGNTSLKGTVISSSDDHLKELEDKKIREIYLADLPDFNELYISNMNF